MPTYRSSEGTLSNTHLAVIPKLHPNSIMTFGDTLKFNYCKYQFPVILEAVIYTNRKSKERADSSNLCYRA